MSGTLPASVTELGLPTSAVYGLDLAFALPLVTLAGIRLLRRDPWGTAGTLAALVWLMLLGLSVLAIFTFEAGAGKPIEPVVVVVFNVITAIAAGLAAIGLLPRRPGRVPVSSVHAPPAHRPVVLRRNTGRGTPTVPQHPGPSSGSD